VPFNRVGFRNQKRGLPKTEIQGVVRTDADAIHAFHATRINNHSILLHLGVDDDVRGARSGAMAALVASVRHPDFSRRELVGESEKSAIGAGVSAESFLAQKIDGHEATDKKKRNGDCDRGKRFPKISSDQMIRELRDKGFVLGFREESIGGRPNKHVESADKRDVDQQPRSKRLRSEANFFEQPSAEILEGENVTAPAADKTSED